MLFGIFFKKDQKMIPFSMLWPLLVIVFSNIVYNIASKSVPKDTSPWAILVLTYLTASFLSFAAYFLVERDKPFFQSILSVNWTGFALGLSMVGLEIGFIFMYRNGWKISVGALLTNILLAVALAIIGFVFYKDQLTFKQIMGILLCLLGSGLIMAN